jgi:hypothetical protein
VALIDTRGWASFRPAMALTSHAINLDNNASLSVVAGDAHLHLADAVQDYEWLLGILKPVSQRDYHVPRCMAGTRENVFTEINLWTNGKSMQSTEKC